MRKKRFNKLKNGNILCDFEYDSEENYCRASITVVASVYNKKELNLLIKKLQKHSNWLEYFTSKTFLKKNEGEL